MMKIMLLMGMVLPLLCQGACSPPVEVEADFSRTMRKLEANEYFGAFVEAGPFSDHIVLFDFQSRRRHIVELPVDAAIDDFSLTHSFLAVAFRIGANYSINIFEPAAGGELTPNSFPLRRLELYTVQDFLRFLNRLTALDFNGRKYLAFSDSYLGTVRCRSELGDWQCENNQGIGGTRSGIKNQALLGYLSEAPTLVFDDLFNLYEPQSVAPGSFTPRPLNLGMNHSYTSIVAANDATMLIRRNYHHRALGSQGSELYLVGVIAGQGYGFSVFDLYNDLDFPIMSASLSNPNQRVPANEMKMAISFTNPRGYPGLSENFVLLATVNQNAQDRRYDLIPNAERPVISGDHLLYIHKDGQTRSMHYAHCPL